MKVEEKNNSPIETHYDEEDFQIEVKNEISKKKQEFGKDISTVAVVGALSFLGYKICKLLLEMGKSVVMGIDSELDAEEEQMIRALVTKFPEERVRVVHFSYLEMSNSVEMLNGCQALIHCGRGSKM